MALPPSAESPARGRKFVLEMLSQWQLADLADTAALLTSELVTNVVLHARTELTLTVRRRPDGLVQVEVLDGSAHAPRRQQIDSDATTGRGLRLLDVLAESWDVITSDAGKKVSFTLAQPSPPGPDSGSGSRRALPLDVET